MAKTDAERAKAYRERQKALKGKDWLKKETERVTKYYVKSSELPKKKLAARRTKIRSYVRKHRQQRRVQNENLVVGSLSAGTNSTNMEIMDSQVSSTSTTEDQSLAIRPSTSSTPSRHLVVRLPTPKSSATRKRVSRAVAKGYRKIEKLEHQNDNLKKKVDSLRKKCERLKVKSLSKSPRGKTDQEIRSCGISPSKHSTIRQKVLLANCIAEEIQVAVKKNPLKKSVIAGVTAGKIIKKYRLTNALSRMTKISKETLLRSSKTLTWTKPRNISLRYKTLKDRVKTFLEREDNSRQMPGKADSVKVDTGKRKEKVQKFVLNDYLHNLFLKFNAENSTLKISLATFCRLRPKYICLVNFTARVTCLCTKHQNFALKLKSLKAAGVNIETSPDRFADRFSESDVQVMLAKIEGDINFHEWKRIRCDDGKQRMKLVNTSVGKAEFMAAFQDEYKLFGKHTSRVKAQYTAFKDMKTKLSEKHVIVQMDFAENYACQSMEEIQSAYWNAEMITLHPAVIYYRDNQNEICHKSIVFVSDVLNHNSSFVRVVVQKVVTAAKQLCPDMTHIHYWTDSPTSQYRNKVMFDLVSQHPEMYDITQSSWHYFEAGHGKGACDGIGGTTKRMADNAVKRGQVSIQSADDFYQWALNTQSQIVYEFVTKIEYEKAFSEVQQRQNMLKPIKGTMKIHAVVSHNDGIMTRETTCTCDHCLRPDTGFDYSYPITGNCIWEKHTFTIKQIHYNDFLEGIMESKVSNSNQESGRVEIDAPMELLSNIHIDVGDYVASIYDCQWFIGKVTEKDDSEYNILFYEKAGKNENCLKWPKVKDEIWVPKNHILCKVEEPMPTGKSKRLFTLLATEMELVQDLHKEWKRLNQQQ